MATKRPPEISDSALVPSVADGATNIPESDTKRAKIAAIKTPIATSALSCPPCNELPELPLADIELEERVGVGNASTIFKGIWKGKEVAVKQYISYRIPQLQAGVMTAFNHEKRMMGLLAPFPHPNVIICYGVCSSEETPSLVIEYIPKSVYQLLQNPFIRDIEWPLRIKIATQVIAGLNHLHTLATPMSHNDLKTDNLLIDDTGHVRIIDFGHASLLAEHKHAETTVFGNPSWTAPECMHGAPFSSKSDIYSFGIILWELITREEPFPGLNEDEVVRLVTQGTRPKVPEDCSPEYAKIMRSCWDGDSSARPDAATLLDQLKHWGKDVPPVTAPREHAETVATNFPFK